MNQRLEDEEEPLDPKVEAIRVRMVRLLIVSGGIMMLGLMAVLAAIVYKITSSGEQSAARIVKEAMITLPAGSTIIDTALDRDRVMLTVEADGKTQVLVFGPDGEVRARYGVDR